MTELPRVGSEIRRWRCRRHMVAQACFGELPEIWPVTTGNLSRNLEADVSTVRQVRRPNFDLIHSRLSSACRRQAAMPAAITMLSVNDSTAQISME